MSLPSENLPLFGDRGSPSAGDPLFFETRARAAGHVAIAGVDEAGRGPLAGPVVAAAVVLHPGLDLPGVHDSKRMTRRAREAAFTLIQHKAQAAAIGVVSPRGIDALNILQASREAMRRAVNGLPLRPDFVLVDGTFDIAVPVPQQCLIKGDQRSRSISAASVLAKVYRDRIMCAQHEMYPVYGFDRNKGYGAAARIRAALAEHGPCPLHRRSFRGVTVTGRERPGQAILFRGEK